MATKRRRGTAWHYTVRRAKLLPRPVYLSFEDEQEGDEYVHRLEALLDRGVVPDEFTEAKKDVRDLRQQVRAYQQAQHVSSDDAKLLKVVTARLPIKLLLSDLTFAWASRWVTELKREQNLSPSTVRHHVGALSRALDWMAAHGYLPMNPLRLLPRGYATYTAEDVRRVGVIDGVAKHDNERDRRLEDGEEQAIRRILAGERPAGRQRALELHHTDALVLMFDMALESCMRMREMFTLTRDQIDLGRRTIFLTKTKNGNKRQVPITSVLEAKLKAYDDDYDGRLFPWWDGSTVKKDMERVTSRLSRQYSRIFSAAGCDDLHFHDLRHEATSRLFERTDLGDLQIASITGHTDPRQLKRYANLRGSQLAARLW